MRCLASRQLHRRERRRHSPTAWRHLQNQSFFGTGARASFGETGTGERLVTAAPELRSEASILYSNGTYTNGPLDTGAAGINNNGQIVRAYYDNVGSGAHGYLYSNGTYTTLNDPNGTYGTVATGINDHGQIVGYFINSKDVEHGFLYSNGTYTMLNDPLGTHGTEVLGINDYGKIVGIYWDWAGTQHGFHT
jgi:probable HAF family extracellular repeat protein